MSLTHEMKDCQRCKNELNTSDKPYVKFQVEQNWKPKPEDGDIKVLFIAESPPRNGEQSYFYNQNIPKRRSLRIEMFKHLKICSLEHFKKEGYYLIDAIKCRLDKNEKKKVPRKVLKTCAEKFLEKEIAELKQKTIIFVLGNSAKKALQQLPEFKELQCHKVTKEYNEILSGYRVILCPFPSSRWNLLKRKSEIKQAFSKIAKVPSP